MNCKECGVEIKKQDGKNWKNKVYCNDKCRLIGIKKKGTWAWSQIKKKKKEVD